MTMSNSMLAAVHAAMNPPHDGSQTEPETSQTRRSSMSETTGMPAAENAGPTLAEMDKATAEARTEGKNEGRTEAVADVARVLASDGIAGNAARMSAAVECLSEGMSAEKATAFATKHVADAAAPKSDASLAKRDEKPDSLAAAGIGEPEKKTGLMAMAEQRYGAAAR